MGRLYIKHDFIYREVQDFLREKYLNKYAIVENTKKPIKIVDIRVGMYTRFFTENNQWFPPEDIITIFDDLDSARLFIETMEV